MTDIYQRFTEALGDIRSAPQPAELWAGLKSFAQPFGYSYLTGADASRLGGGAATAIFYSDGIATIMAFDRLRDFAQLPFITRGLASAEPFLISKLRDDPKTRGVWVDLLAEPVRNGEGVAVPVHEAGRPAAGFIFGGAKPDVSSGTIAMLQILAHAAFERYRKLLDTEAAGPLYGLSAREIQCLRGAAAGRGDAEVGAALGISARTVRFHIDGAKVKLGAKSRIQAIAKALHEKIISI